MQQKFEFEYDLLDDSNQLSSSDQELLEAAKKATKEFGKLLPKPNKGVEPYEFAVVKTKAKNYRLAIKSGSYVAHEFMTNLTDDGVLTADIVKNAVSNIIKMNPEEFNESMVNNQSIFSDIVQDFEDFVKEKKSLNEASRRKVHKAAKQGSYPAVIVVVQDGKVIHQEPVSTPDVAPATFNVMQEKYPKAVLHLEDNTGKRLFTENMKRLKSFDNFVAEKKSLINEAKAYKLKASEFGADTHSAAYNVKGETTWRVHSTYAIDQVSGENNPEERDVVFFEAMPINNDIYIKIGGINNLKRTNGSTYGNNFGTTIDEWKIDPKGIAKEASDFLTDATHLKWINKKARSEGQVIKWALKDDYSSVIEDLVNKSLGLSEGIYAKQSKIQPGDYIQTQYGYFYKRVEGQVGGQDAYVEIKKGVTKFRPRLILPNGVKLVSMSPVYVELINPVKK